MMVVMEAPRVLICALGQSIHIHTISSDAPSQADQDSLQAQGHAFM